MTLLGAYWHSSSQPEELRNFLAIGESACREPLFPRESPMPYSPTPRHSGCRRFYPIFPTARRFFPRPPSWTGNSSQPPPLHGLTFFSDDLALLASLPGISRQASHEAVADFLTLGYIPALRTIYQEIRKIPAGHQFLHGEMRRIPLPDTLTELPMHFDEAMEFFRNRLKALPGEILERHPQLDVMLSGGIDSGTLLELLQEFYPDDSRKAITAVFQERTTMNSP